MVDVVIIGAGAAGLFAAVSAINKGYKVLVLEKMAVLQRKRTLFYSTKIFLIVFG